MTHYYSIFEDGELKAIYKLYSSKNMTSVERLYGPFNWLSDYIYEMSLDEVLESWRYDTRIQIRPTTQADKLELL